MGRKPVKSAGSIPVLHITEHNAVNNEKQAEDVVDKKKRPRDIADLENEGDHTNDIQKGKNRLVPLYDIEGMKVLSTKDKMEWSYYMAHFNSI